jgi:hypothetical protein
MIGNRPPGYESSGESAKRSIASLSGETPSFR